MTAHSRLQDFECLGSALRALSIATCKSLNRVVKKGKVEILECVKFEAMGGARRKLGAAELAFVNFC